MLPNRIRSLTSLLKAYFFNSKKNNVNFQKLHWQQQLQGYDWNSHTLYGNLWGDPERSDNVLGDYPALKKKLQSLVTNGSTVLEIGSLGGKWTQYIQHADKIICVDIVELGFDYIQKKIPHPNIQFYLTQGDELTGIPNASVDLVFSIDSLVRAPEQSIIRYIKESARVLKPNGRIFLHLPCRSIMGSLARGYTPLALTTIKKTCRANRLKELVIDTKLIRHGLFIQAQKLYA